jgi:hypothetical protein
MQINEESFYYETPWNNQDLSLEESFVEVTVEEDVESTSQSALENKSWITMSEQLLHSIEWEMAKAKEIHPMLEANKSCTGL